MEVRLNIHSTTGGVLIVQCHLEYTVEHLKRTIARRLRLTKDRICLLYRDRQLSEGTLKDNGLVDGAKLILLPSVETGLLTQRPENSVMQALESLNDSQVNDFLSGKTPLNLTMRLGDHMMLIQLQLSTLKAVKTQTSSAKRTRSTKDDPVPSSSKSEPPGDETPTKSAPSETDNDSPSSSSSTATRKNSNGDELKTFLRKQDIETLQSAFEIFKSLAEMRDDMDKNADDSSTANRSENSDNSPSKFSFSSDSSVRDDASVASESRFGEQSPIESLSNLVSSPLKSYERSASSAKNEESTNVSSGTKYVPLPSSLKNNLVECLMGAESDADVTEANEISAAQTLSDPIAANLTSCLCSTLNPNYSRNGCTDHSSEAHCSYDGADVNCDASSSDFVDNSGTVLDENVIDSGGYFESQKPKDNRDSNKNKRLHYLLHKTSKSSNPITQNKQKIVIHPLINKFFKKKRENPSEENKPSTSKSADCESSSSTSKTELDSFVFPSSSSSSSYPVSVDPSPVSDTKALFEASKNLTQTLKKLSKEVLTNKVDLENEESTRSKIGQGAVIESMKHHGKGIYSGTFSGTLNPALQDRFGRPKRDISTIIHILNDLLCATPPQYRSGARMTFEPTHNQSTRLRQRDAKQSNEICKADHGESTECSCNKCTVQTKCPYGECNGHYPSPNLDSNNCPCKSSDISNDSALEICSCSPKRGQSDNHKCNDCSDKKNECKRCCSAKDTLAMENSKTKCKLDQLRLVMQQKKQRREARKMKTAPYVNSTSSSSSNIVSSEPPTSVIAEEIDTVA